MISRGPTIPSGLKQSDDDLLQRLLSIAAAETKESNSPCRYLGQKVVENRHEPDPSLWGASSKTNVTVFFEWLHVSHHGAPHVVCCAVHDLLHHGRRVPLNPLRHTCPSGLVLDVEFFESVAKNVHEKIEFKGVAFEGDCHNILHQLPNDGKDVQHEPVYWTLPDGRAVCWSLLELTNKKPDELIQGNAAEAYITIATELLYEPLGMLPEDQLNEFCDHPGTLEERLWKNYSWDFPPENETMPCWWVCNLDEEDLTKETKMICRSLAALHMELCHSRLATTHKLRQEHDKRLENNALAVDRIQENRELWFRSGGCDPTLLLTPTGPLKEHATSTVNVLSEMLKAHGPAGGLDSFVEDITNAVEKIKIVTWEAIKKDRFNLTPDGIYNDLVRNAEHIISSWGRDYERRQSRMRQPLEMDAEAKLEADKEVNEISFRRCDKYGLTILNIDPRGSEP